MSLTGEKRTQIALGATGAAATFLITTSAYAETVAAQALAPVDIVAPCFLGAALGGGITAYICACVSRKRIDELSQRVAHLEQLVTEETQVAPRGKHAATSAQHKTLAQIMEIREKLESQEKQVQRSLQSESKNPSQQSQDDLQTQQALTSAENTQDAKPEEDIPATLTQSEVETYAETIQNEYVKNPLDEIEPNSQAKLEGLESSKDSSQPSSSNGIHTAIELDMTEDELADTPPFDYASFASDYVAKKSFKERMLTISKGVGKVLGERLDAANKMMEDMPVIQRADGSVGDVGTDWWALAAQANDLEISSRFDVDVEPVEQSAQVYNNHVEACVTSAWERLQAQAVQYAQAASQRGPVGNVIAARVQDPFSEQEQAQMQGHAQTQGSTQTHTQAEVPNHATFDASLFSAATPNTAQPEQEKDEWTRSLEAMDRHFDDNLLTENAMPVFFDLIGGTDTIDEPDGLEGKTEFLNFRAPAGHPEVVDTNSYINYLVVNELAAKQKSMGKRARRYLKLLDGGSKRKAL